MKRKSIKTEVLMILMSLIFFGGTVLHNGAAMHVHAEEEPGTFATISWPVCEHELESVTEEKVNACGVIVEKQTINTCKLCGQVVSTMIDLSHDERNAHHAWEEVLVSETPATKCGVGPTKTYKHVCRDCGKESGTFVVQGVAPNSHLTRETRSVLVGEEDDGEYHVTHWENRCILCDGVVMRGVGREGRAPVIEQIVTEPLVIVPPPEEPRINAPDPKVPECVHKRKWKVTKTSTCSEYGEVVYYCEVCDEVLEKRKVDKAPKKHTDFTERIKTNPTYKSDGVKEFKCTGCGYTYTESIPRLVCGHANIGMKHNDNTHKYYDYCRDCGEQIGEEYEWKLPCNHIGYATEDRYITEPTETNDGVVGKFCKNCGKEREGYRFTIHAYQEYKVDLGGGKTATYYGYFDNAAAMEVVRLTNEYRKSVGLTALKHMPAIQNAANTRALECAYLFDHKRPDGSQYTTAASGFIHGENIAKGSIKTPESVMAAWKNSSGHNANLLYPGFKSVSVGCFRRYVFNEGSLRPSELTYWSQNFSYVF